MKWKERALSLGHGKKKHGSSSKEKGTGPSSPSKRHSAPGGPGLPPTPGSNPNGPGLGTLRLGVLRADSAPICTPTPRAKRQLISELLEAGREDEQENPSSTASPALRRIISNKSSSGKSFDKEVGKGDSFSSYTPEEKVAFACHLNSYLTGDPFLEHLLPLDPEGRDFFSKFEDGVLMCRLVCLAIPGSVADVKVNVPAGAEPLSLYKSTENLNAALTAAEAAGLQVVNIGARDIIDGRPSSILGLSWQLIRVHLLAQINLKGCPDLIHLMEEGESKEEFFELPVEEVLLRWFNHHLRWGGSERRVSNFSEDLSDGKCYVTLIKELNDDFKGEDSDSSDGDTKRVSFRRACLVISGAEGIGLAPLIRPRHITGRAHLYNIAFVAQLLNRRPRIHRESLHLKASVRMQAWFRMVRVMQHTSPIFEERRASATTMSRACRRWMQLRRRERAATTLQARWRGTVGRAETSTRRREVERAAAAESAKAAASAAASKERFRQIAAATELQAWARGMETRQVVSTALSDRGLPPVGESGRLRGSSGQMPPLSCGPNLKESQAGSSISPRTSVSSSVRFSEDSPLAEAVGFPFAAAAGNGEKTRTWFDAVFAGMSMPGIRGSNNPKKQEAAAAIVIQRWRRGVTEGRLEAVRATGEAAKRRRAVEALHRAYANRWRFEVGARRRTRQKWDEEARQANATKTKGTWFGGLWGEILRVAAYRSGGLGGDGEDEQVIRARRQALEAKAREGGDCCDTAGQGVLSSEVEGWKSSYLNTLVLNGPSSEAQEARARVLQKTGGDDHAWRPPEDPLSTGRVVAMAASLFFVVFENSLSGAASASL